MGNADVLHEQGPVSHFGRPTACMPVATAPRMAKAKGLPEAWDVSMMPIGRKRVIDANISNLPGQLST